MGGPFACSETAQNRTIQDSGPARRWLRRPFLLLLSATAPFCFFAPLRLSAAAPGPGRAPTVVDIDLSTGSTRVSGPDRDTAAAPGSTLKPMVLLTGLRLGAITPHSRIACRGVLRVAGRNLACAHPASLGVLDAEEALAYSCNSYFAALARQLSSPALQRSLRHYGIEAVHPALASPEARVLFALGLEGVAVTPLQLAHAYAKLARDPGLAAGVGAPVRQGLLGSVSYGMAHAAQVSGVVLGGKTGTAHDPAPMLQHGWFAGIVFAGADASARPLRVLAVFAPGGSGNDAAVAAREYLQKRRW